MSDDQQESLRPRDLAVDYSRMMSSLSVVIGTAQIMAKNLQFNRQMTPEQELRLLTTIQRSGWEAARLARVLHPDGGSVSG